MSDTTMELVERLLKHETYQAHKKLTAHTAALLDEAAAQRRNDEIRGCQLHRVWDADPSDG